MQRSHQREIRFPAGGICLTHSLGHDRIFLFFLFLPNQLANPFEADTCHLRYFFFPIFPSFNHT